MRITKVYKANYSFRFTNWCNQNKKSLCKQQPTSSQCFWLKAGTRGCFLKIVFASYFYIQREITYNIKGILGKYLCWTLVILVKLSACGLHLCCKMSFLQVFFWVSCLPLSANIYEELFWMDASECGKGTVW